MSKEEFQSTTKPITQLDEQVKETEISSKVEEDAQKYTSNIWISTQSNTDLSDTLQQQSIELDKTSLEQQTSQGTSFIASPTQPQPTTTPTITATTAAIPAVATETAVTPATATATATVATATPATETATANKEKEKPPVGSPEWKKLRRDNHKEVERRRREIINDGITEISRLVPGCEKNKGSILQRAAVYIRQLKDSEAATVEKWTLEKLLSDQAISELNRQVDMLKVEIDRARLENDFLKRELENANERTQLHHQEQEAKRQKLEHE